MSVTALLKVRPVRPEDEPFLAELFAATERERLAEAPVEVATLEAVIRHELAGQQRHYRRLDQEATHCLILAEERPAGRFLFWENREEIRLAELTVAPAFRGLGIGSAVIGLLKARAIESRRPVRLHVEKYHVRQPGRFYQRQGFRVIEDRQTHWFLEWEPGREMARAGSGQLKMTS